MNLAGSASSLAILPYEDVRTSEDPRRALPTFCESAYEARRAPRRLGRQRLHLERVPFA